jgi:hypothetical protein
MHANRAAQNVKTPCGFMDARANIFEGLEAVSIRLRFLKIRFFF